MEQLLVLLVLILIPLGNYLLERMRRRHEPPPDPRHRPADMGSRRPAAPLYSESSGRERVQDAIPVIVASRPVSTRAGSRFFRSKREMRRAIIAMTVLGPCRANDPPD